MQDMDDMQVVATLVAALDAQIHLTGLLLVSLVKRALLKPEEALAHVRQAQIRLNSKHNDPMMQIHIDDAYELVAIQIEAADTREQLAESPAATRQVEPFEPPHSLPRKLPRWTQLTPDFE